MARYKLTIEYDGSKYAGWQLQKGAKSVQGALIDACKVVFPNQKIELYGAGRTDQGVHALAQVAHLEANAALKPLQLQHKLNDALPSDVVVKEVQRAAPTFHARYDAKQRIYLYQVSRRPSAFGKKMVWWVKDPLDINLMRQVAALYVGLKDYKTFAEPSDETPSTKVEISRVDVVEHGDLVLVRISGSHFLWKQVRRMVGVMVEVGRGKLSLAEVESYFHKPSDVPAKLTAPAAGLFLEKVLYEADSYTSEVQPVINIG